MHSLFELLISKKELLPTPPDPKHKTPLKAILIGSTGKLRGPQNWFSNRLIQITFCVSQMFIASALKNLIGKDF